MGQKWWSKQIEFADLIRRHDRVAAKAGHSVGKTYLVAAMVQWYLHCFAPAIVITTAPSTDQVSRILWEEIRSQARQAKARLLPGLYPKKSEWHVADLHYAIGLCTDKGERFRGTHTANMLFIFDEANGVPHFAFEEAENMCTAPANKIVLIGNPVDPRGDFFDTFKAGAGWETLTISCLDHPNVIHGKEVYPGAVSRQWVDERVKKLCQPIEADEVDADRDFEWPRRTGKWWRPGPVFQSRVLGEFPSEGPDQLVPMSRVVYAETHALPLDETLPVDLGMDVAYRGGDYCVIYARQGPSVFKREKWQGVDPDRALRRVGRFIKDLTNEGKRIGTVAVDAIGIGAGVAYGLMRMKDEGEIHCDRVLAIQVSERASDSDTYEMKRGELAFGLAERFRNQKIDLSRLPEGTVREFEDQATQITREFGSKLRLTIQSKDRIREQTGTSPDDFDAMCLCFVDTLDVFAEMYADLIR